MLHSVCSDSVVIASQVFSDLKRPSGSLFLEILSLIERRKRVLRLVVAISDVRFVRSVLESAGLKVSASGRALRDVWRSDFGENYSSWASTATANNGKTVLYASWSVATSMAAADLDDAEDSQSLGLLLGYPKCCVSAYASLPSTDPWWYRYAVNAAPDKQCYPLSNKIASLLGPGSFLYDYFPCSVSCAASAQLAEANFLALDSGGIGEVARTWMVWHSGTFLVGKSVVIRCDDEGKPATWKTTFPFTSIPVLDRCPRTNHSVDVHFKDHWEQTRRLQFCL